MLAASAPFQFPLRLGFGCSGALGEAWFSERRAAALIEQALEGGVRYFDTAPFYGHGEAERRLGAALRKAGGKVFVSTKTGTRRAGGRAVKDFTEENMRADVETSLRRLGRERLDLLFLHGPALADLERAQPILDDLEREGKIARWGVCGADAGLRQGIEAGAHAIMGVYNVLDARHGDIFRKAKARGVGVVAIEPLAQGLYSRDFFRLRGPADAWRIARAAMTRRDALKRARAAGPLLESVEGWTPAQLAMAFVRADPDIDVALTTTTRPVHLAETLAALDRLPPPDEILARLKALASGVALGAALDAPPPGA